MMQLSLPTKSSRLASQPATTKPAESKEVKIDYSQPPATTKPAPATTKPAGSKETKRYYPTLPAKDLATLAIEGNYQAIITANLSVEDREGDKHTRALVYGQHPEVTEELIKHGADVTTQNNLSLLTACKMGVFRTVQLLLNSGAVASSPLLLYHACENGYDDILHLLLFQSSHSITSSQIETLTQHAKERGHFRCVDILNPDTVTERDAMLEMLSY